MNGCFVCTQRAAADGQPCRIMDDKGQDLTLGSTRVGPLKPTEWPVVLGLDSIVSVKTDGIWKKEITRFQEQALAKLVVHTGGHLAALCLLIKIIGIVS